MIPSTILIQAQATVDAGGNLDQGVAIAIAGLLIVFTALILISLFIASLPRLLLVVARIWPEVDDAHLEHGHPESGVPEDGAVLAAIGYVLHTEIQKQLAAERASTTKG